MPDRLALRLPSPADGFPLNHPHPVVPLHRVAVIGGGPAGLMAAEVLAGAGAALEVQLFDAMPSVGRKFLLAGKGGLNLTHSEGAEAFLGRYGERSAQMAPLLSAFGPDPLRAWAQELGVETFVGSSGRVFPKDMKAAPLLRAWLQRLRVAGVKFSMRHRWLGWADDGALRFATPVGETSFHADAVVLALGGGSWARLGSDGAWVPLLSERGVAVAPLQPSNCGFDVGPEPHALAAAEQGETRREFFRELIGQGPSQQPGWTEHFASRFAGQPFKSVATWDTEVIAWQGNEVELFHGGQLLRLDRLVQRRDAGHEGHWWVLDYKSNAAPQRLPELVATMQAYRAAVQALHRGHTVKAAFLTPQGALLEIDRVAGR